ncbi:MAG: carbonic anhydrase [Verrucomicrobia bacterium]|nr:carbonic anhydrase [Verrucomicrobiota bacterium]
MKHLILTLLFSVTLFAQGAKVASPAEGYQLLMQGNERFVKGQLLHPDRDEVRRVKTVAGQTPFGTILGCSDSRVPPEILFDQGVGDLFVVRVAGNVVGPIELASIEYSVIYLGSKILIVLGHENCGAVDAVQQGKTKDIEPIAELISPAIKPNMTLENAVKENVKNVVGQLEKNPVLADLIKKKQFAVVGGYYDLVSGKVIVLTPAPTHR